MIRDALHAYGATAGRSFSEDRSQTVGASEVGQCARKIAFAKASDDAVAAVVQDDDFEDGWGAKRRGSIIEDNFFVPAVRARFGDRALFVGGQQRTFVSGFLSATPDGLLIDQPRDALVHLGVTDCLSGEIDLDCKTIDPRTKLDAPKPEHEFQVIAQMGLIRETTNYRPEYAVLTYIDASFLDKVQEFAVRFNADDYAEAKNRARQIMTARHPADIRPEGVVAGGKECDLCPFTGPCGQARAARVPVEQKAIDQQIAERIAARAMLVKFKERDLKALTAEVGELKQSIRDDLEQAGTKSLPGVVSWSAVKGRRGWDNEGIRTAAMAAGIDLAPFQTEGDPSDRLTISLKG